MYPKEEKEEKEEDDIEASIAKEVAEIKDSSSDKKRFANITTGTDCCKEYIYTNMERLIYLLKYYNSGIHSCNRSCGTRQFDSYHVDRYA